MGYLPESSLRACFHFRDLVRRLSGETSHGHGMKEAIIEPMKTRDKTSTESSSQQSESSLSVQPASGQWVVQDLRLPGIEWYAARRPLPFSAVLPPEPTAPRCGQAL